MCRFCNLFKYGMSIDLLLDITTVLKAFQKYPLADRQRLHPVLSENKSLQTLSRDLLARAKM